MSVKRRLASIVGGASVKQLKNFRFTCSAKCPWMNFLRASSRGKGRHGSCRYVKSGREGVCERETMRRIRRGERESWGLFACMHACNVSGSGGGNVVIESRSLHILFRHCLATLFQVPALSSGPMSTHTTLPSQRRTTYLMKMRMLLSSSSLMTAIMLAEMQPFSSPS